MTVNQLLIGFFAFVAFIILWDEHAYAQWKHDNPGYIYSAELIKGYAPPPSPKYLRSEDIIGDNFRSPYWRFR